MRIFDNDIEIIKAYSTLWRTSPECCQYVDNSKGDEAFMSGNDPLDFLQLPNEAQSALIEWIDYALTPHENYICPDSSYGIKHVYERDTGKYVTNGQFKGAMVHFGFDPVDPRDLNCHYRVKVNTEVLERTS